MKSKGFTLLEVLIVMALLVILGSLTFNQVSKSFRVERRSLEWRMASLVKYLYNTAATENKTVRLVFDFKERTYWAEATAEKFRLSPNRDMSPPVEKTKKEEKTVEEGKDETEIAPFEASFGAIESPLMSKRQLPSKIFLEDIQTSHDEKPVTEGVAYIYFFPNGYVEPSIINFKDESGERHISIRTNTYNSDVSISEEYGMLENKKK